MISKIAKLSFVLSLISATFAHATLQGIGGRITNLRVEAPYVFLGYAGTMPGCGTRIYLNMNDQYFKTFYSMALTAFALGKNVYMRADDASPRVFGECRLFDIYVNE